MTIKADWRCTKNKVLFSKKLLFFQNGTPYSWNFEKFHFKFCGKLLFNTNLLDFKVFLLLWDWLIIFYFLYLVFLSAFLQIHFSFVVLTCFFEKYYFYWKFLLNLNLSKIIRISALLGNTQRNWFAINFYGINL